MSDSASPEPPVQKSPLSRTVIDGPIMKDPEIEAYRITRDAIAEKFGGLIPVAEGWIFAVDIGQQGDGEVLVRMTLRLKNLDQIALMAAPTHNMRVLLLEDRRRK